MDENHTEIPSTRNCVLALVMDMKKEKENLLMGEMREVQKHLLGAKGDTLLLNVNRPLGSFLMECFQVLPHIADTYIPLLDNIGELDNKKSPYFERSRESLTGLYHSENLCHQFLSIRMWQQYRLWDKQVLRKKRESIDYRSWMDDLTLPFRFPLQSDVMEWQNFNPQNPLKFLEKDFVKHSLTLSYSSRAQEYAVADVSLMLLIVYSLKRLYENKQYFQKCKVCEKLFLAGTPNIPTLCSEECRREQRRLNKRRYDDEKRDVSYEKSAKATYMYWYKRVKPMEEKDDTDPAYLAEVQTAFREFCEESVKRKEAVEANKVKAADYESWLLAQRNVIDGLISNTHENAD